MVINLDRYQNHSSLERPSVRFPPARRHHKAEVIDMDWHAVSGAYYVPRYVVESGVISFTSK